MCQEQTSLIFTATGSLLAMIAVVIAIIWSQVSTVPSMVQHIRKKEVVYSRFERTFHTVHFALVTVILLTLSLFIYFVPWLYLDFSLIVTCVVTCILMLIVVMIITWVYLDGLVEVRTLHMFR